MKKYLVTRFYRAKEGFTIEADNPEAALEIMKENPPERDFDEYLSTEAVYVFTEDSIHPVLEFEE
jgi:hypothetical protein